MKLKETPPLSPLQEMDISDEEDLFEDDVEEIDIPENEVHQSDIEDDEADNQHSRDDSSLVFTKHNGAVFSCDLEPGNGNLALSGAQDDMAYVWDTNSGEVFLSCTEHKDSVTCVGFNHDGAYVATGDMSGYIQVWKLATKSKIWETDIGDISWLRWHPGANVLLATSITGEVYMWKIPGGDCKVLPGHGIRSECGCILPDGRRLAVGYDDGSVNVFDMKSSTVLHHVIPNQGSSDCIFSIDCHFDNNLLLYGAEESYAYMMKSQTGKVVCRFDCGGEPNARDGVEAVGFCKDPSTPWAATGTLGGILTIWDISKQARRHVHQQDEGITKLLWLKTNLILTGGTDGAIRLYDGRSGNVEKEFHGHSKDIFDLILSPDNHRILSASEDETVRIFNIDASKG